MHLLLVCLCLCVSWISLLNGLSQFCVVRSNCLFSSALCISLLLSISVGSFDFVYSLLVLLSPIHRVVESFAFACPFFFSPHRTYRMTNTVTPVTPYTYRQRLNEIAIEYILGTSKWTVCCSFSNDRENNWKRPVYSMESGIYNFFFSFSNNPLFVN